MGPSLSQAGEPSGTQPLSTAMAMETRTEEQPWSRHFTSLRVPAPEWAEGFVFSADV
jgi:hypothetical protein